MRPGRRVRVASHFPSSLISNRATSSSPGSPAVQVSLSTSMPVLLSEQDVRIVLSIRDLIDTMETALVTFSAGNVAQPLRTVIEVGLQRAFVGVMPAFLPEPAALGTKVVSVFGSNAAVGLPTHLATIVLLDPMTGELLSIMDGRFITEARTAAVSAVSAKHLARSDASKLAIIGSGVQARSHLDAIGLVRKPQ